LIHKRSRPFRQNIKERLCLSVLHFFSDRRRRFISPDSFSPNRNRPLFRFAVGVIRQTDAAETIFFGFGGGLKN